MNRARARNALSVFVRTGLVSALGMSPAFASTVTSNADSWAGSLRAAIDAAVSGDTIDFDCVALNCPTTITLSSQGNNQGFPGRLTKAVGYGARPHFVPGFRR
jgi:hypothetical protein